MKFSSLTRKLDTRVSWDIPELFRHPSSHSILFRQIFEASREHMAPGTADIWREEGKTAISSVSNFPVVRM